MGDINPHPEIVDDDEVNPTEHIPTIENMKPGDVENRVADQYGRPILTVGALKQMLADAEDDRHVVIATTDWYRNIHVVVIPGDWDSPDTQFSCVTIFPGEKLDPRQF